jgi:hypothetical protein
MVELFTSMPFSSTYNILVVNNTAGNIARWSGNGRLYINQGGLEVAAGQAVLYSVGFLFQEKFGTQSSVCAGGFLVKSGILQVDSGVTIVAGGLQVQTDGATIVSGGLLVTDTGASFATKSTSQTTLQLNANNIVYQNAFIQVLSSE